MAETEQMASGQAGDEQLLEVNKNLVQDSLS
jgi:hypothetical protein